MDAPSGHKDLIADTEQSIAEQERKLRDERERLNELRNRPVTVDESGSIVPADDNGPREVDWPHTTIEYKGETFNVRRPQPQALTMFAIATGRYVSEMTQRDLISLFMTRHMSPKSFIRFNERMMDPDEPDFDAGSMGEMMRLISTLGTSRPIERSRG